MQPVAQPVIKPAPQAAMVVPPPTMQAPKPMAPKSAPMDGGGSVVMETDDGFSTFKVMGTDDAAVKAVAQAGKDAKKPGCDCLNKCGPNGGPTKAEQLKKEKDRLEKDKRKAEDEAEEKKKASKDEVKKAEEKAKKDDEDKKKEVEALTAKAEQDKAKAAATKKQAEDAEDREIQGQVDG